MPILTGGGYSVITDTAGRPFMYCGESVAALPTSGVPEGAMAWVMAEKRIVSFTSGAWAGGIVASQLDVEGTAEIDSTLLVTGVTTSYGGVAVPASEVVVDDGAIASLAGTVILNKAGAIAATLAAPTDVVDDGKILRVISITAQAHTVTQAAPGFNNGGAASDVATFGAAIGNCFTCIAHGGIWFVTAKQGVTLG